MCECFSKIIMRSLKANAKEKCTKQTNQTTKLSAPNWIVAQAKTP